ncbi:MAG: cache domain-containing protein [Bacillota bacterium]
MRWSMSQKMIISLIVVALSTAILLSLASYTTTKRNLIGSAQQKLISDIQLGYSYLDIRIPGEWSIIDGKLYKGSVMMNGNYEIVDEIGELTGGNTVTIFQMDTRIATNVRKPDGERAVDTKVSDNVAEVVLNKHERYLGRANVVGSWNQTGYDPIFNAEGEVIGIWYTGVPEEPYINLSLEAAMQTIAIAAISVVIVLVLGYIVLKNIIIKPLSMLHELNQPLNSIKVTVDGMLYCHKRGTPPALDKIMDNLEKVSIQVKRIEYITKHMRRFIRDEAPGDLVPCDLNLAVEGALNLVGKQIVSHGIEFKKTLADNLPAIKGDQVRLEEVIMNLLINALQALETVDQEEKYIYCRTWLTDKVNLEIRDNGPGIKEEFRNKIFDPFFTTKKQKGNMGLGLSIVHTIVNSLGGKIYLVDHEQDGAAFRIEFPVYKG